MKKMLLFFVVAAFLFSANVKAQDKSLEETIQSLSEVAVNAYVNPLVSAFGSNLNSGWVNGTPSAKVMGFDFELKFVGIGSFFTDANKTFNASGSFRFTDDQADLILQNSGYSPTQTGYQQMKDEILSRSWEVNISGPTVVGKKTDYIQVEFPGEVINGQTVAQYALELTGVGGVADDLPVLPSGAIQLGLGTVYGTTLGIRYLPSIEVEDIGKINYWGLGAMHNPSAYLPMEMIPVDLSAAFFFQSLKVGDLMESKATQFGIYASKTFGAGISVTPYLGLTMESSKTTVNYEYEFDTPAGAQKSKLSLELEGENSFGTTVGSKFSFGFFNLFVDYKLAKTNTASAGISFAF